MNIWLTKTVAESIGFPHFEQFGINKDSWGWKGRVELPLATMSKEKRNKLSSLFETHRSLHGVGVLLGDIKRFEAVLDSAGEGRPRNCEQFCDMLGRFLLDVPGHRLYQQLNNGAALVAFYVDEVQYHPAYQRDGHHYPAFTDIHLYYEEFGGMDKNTTLFYADDVRGKSVEEALLIKGYLAETPELRAEYLTQLERFHTIVGGVGKQYWFNGPGEELTSARWGHTSNVTLDSARVVVDVFYEEGKDRRDRVHPPSPWFWSNKRKRIETNAKEDDDEEDDDETDFDDTVEPEQLEIPIHPYVAVFDLKRHDRFKVHINFLEEYQYDKAIASKLIIPDSHRALIKLLIHHRHGAFTDIIRGKSGGAVVLLSGRPGVGKTLTAEVYAEAEGRPLYSVQCAQLGTDPEELEKNLLAVFSRARRWGAITLLDEADVYVRTRSSDLQQNAIVGVFLRVLEYQSSVLFLTTNRPQDVDDAIASRCIARLHYRTPGVESQKQIWKVLTQTAGLNMAEEEIESLVDGQTVGQGLSGRDIKNLLKLSGMALGGTGNPITKNVIEFVRQFRPTGSEKDEVDPDRDMETPPPPELVKVFGRRRTTA